MPIYNKACTCDEADTLYALLPEEIPITQKKQLSYRRDAYSGRNYIVLPVPLLLSLLQFFAATVVLAFLSSGVPGLLKILQVDL